jgi:hypothetical protein
MRYGNPDRIGMLVYGASRTVGIKSSRCVQVQKKEAETLWRPSRTMSDVRGKGVYVEVKNHLGVLNPDAGETLAQVPLSGETDVDRCVRIAVEAL